MSPLAIGAIIFLIVTPGTLALPDEGKWDTTLASNSHMWLIAKSLYKDSGIYVHVNCENLYDGSSEINITLGLAVVISPCWDFTEAAEEATKVASQIKTNYSYVYRFSNVFKCNDHILLNQVEAAPNDAKSGTTKPVYTTQQDAIYVLALVVHNASSPEFHVRAHVEMKTSHGYLSAADYPSLIFYGVMCIVYFLYGLIWLVLCFKQWRDLLRVQFWIGGVILLGMLEKATFYCEYESINNTGVRIQGAMLFAEWVSCAKRTVARMLVVIVSLGFGIVKPRLGATLHRVVGVGLLYFFLAASESYLRVTQRKNEQSKDLLVASVPLAVLDSAICWWIFNALVNTTRTLRLRRNEIKLALYRHFTNTLIFAIISSVIYMLYSIKTHRLIACLNVWKDLWLDDAYWHILFSSVLLVIMILWRPTNNNQRYAFVPLLETGDDEEEEQLVNDAYGVKVRMHNQSSPSPKPNTVDEDLKWLEENVKSDPVIAILDSDEELVNTRFEVSKMQ